VRGCTIIAKNYLAQARVLADSFLQHHPGSTFTVLVIDEIDGYFDPDDEAFKVLTPADIECEPFGQMAVRYDLLELSTAVKPWLLRQQLRDGAESITYLDPDIQVFGPLNALHDHAVAHGLALTPHNLHPIPDDGLKPTQIDIMVAGVYNLGYVSVASRPDTDELLEWWCERLIHDCRVDPLNGYFVDQRWFDLAPGFVGGQSIIRDPEYNVAYWNAHSRTLSLTEDGYAVDGRPLAFFHFSGYDPARPGVLSRHQTRLDLDRLPVLRAICSEYAVRVNAHGYREARHWPYTFSALPTGEKLSPIARTLWELGEEAGVLSLPPFTEPGYSAFVRWATEQDPDSPEGISRTLGYLYERRPDVQRAHPDLAGISRDGFIEWARHFGPLEHELPLALLPGAVPVTAAPAPPGDPTMTRSGPGPEALAPPVIRIPQGVNVVGYLRSELGVGEAARQVIRALDAADVPLVPLHGATIPLSRQGHAFHHLDPDDARFPVNLICMNADALPDFARHAGRSFFADRYTAGLWFWEVSTPAAGGWADAFGLLDEVWASSRYVADTIRLVSPIPVVQVRLPIELRPVKPVGRDVLGASDGFMFLFSFDYLSVFERKNPLAVIEAFRRAIEPGQGATLVIKCINHELDPESHARLLGTVAERDDITVLDGYLDPDLKNSLTAACDCYVSLHRAEGFGLTMAEAMYLGKPVIATGYSGNLDFMTADNSWLIDYTMVEIGPDAAPYPMDGTWAEPDVDQAATAMRTLVDDPGRARALGGVAAASIRETHSAAAAGAVLRDRLHVIYQTRRVEPPVDESGSDRWAVAGRAPPQLRRVAERAMKPLTVHRDAAELRFDRLGDRVTRSETADLPAALHALREVAEVRSEVAEVRWAVDALDALRAPALERINRLDQGQSRMEAEARALPYMADGGFVVADEPGLGRVQGYRGASSEGDDVYRSFEDTFRGSEEFIRERQRRFIPLLRDHGPVLDVGCGRGEMLDLLRDSEISYIGVDSDAGMLDRCRAKGHTDIELGDGIAYLGRRAPESFGAVFCAQVIEHLPFEQLMRFLEFARRAITPGGVLIAETVNPHSAPALKTFWIDLTHQHPIFPEVTLALSRAVGFERAYVFHPNGTGDVEADRFTTGEYALVAHTSERATTP
jgi:glycosyltransferase involved in cell wall biosynthesis/SAM-dependent methyltransferase